MHQTKKLALCGVFAGLSLAIMWMISFIPAMDYALPAMAGLLVIPVISEYGRRWALGVYLAAGILGMLLVPNKIVPLLYVGFFGYYPILKSLFARRLPLWAERLLLQGIFNVAAVSAVLLGGWLFGIEGDDMLGFLGPYAPLVMLLCANIAFFAFDYAIGNFWRVYDKKWRKKLQRMLRGN